MRLFIFLYSLFAVLHTSVRAQEHNFRNFNVENGLGQSQVYAIYQDPMGRMWFGTRGGGISTFNGVEFETYANKDGLAGNFVNRMIGDAEKGCWIATTSGLSYYDGIQFKSILFEGLTNAPNVRDLLRREDGTIMCGTSKGLFVVSKAKLTAKRVGNREVEILSLVERKGVVWMGTDGGLLSLENGSVNDWSKASDYMKNSITTLKLDESNNLWIGTYGDGAYCYNGTSFFRVDYHHELYRETILDIYVDKHQLWMATLKSGVVCYDQNTKVFSRIGEAEGLSNRHVRSIAKDNNDHFWFGTSGGGVCQYLGKQFTTFDEQSGLGGNFIYAITRDHAGNLWVGNSSRGVSVITQEGIKQFDGSNGFINSKVKALSTDKLGTVWIGTDGDGVFVYENGIFSPVKGLERTYIRAINVKRNGSVFIATAGNGIIQVTRKKKTFILEKFTENDGLLSNRLTALHFDKWGRLWYATENHGVGCLSFQKGANGVTTQTYSMKNGLPSNAVRCLAEDKSGKLWLGFAGNGVASLSIYEKEKAIVQINSKNGLASENVYSFIFDRFDDLIIGSEKGLDYVFFGDDRSIKRIKHYGKTDGFTGVETCQNAVWKDDDGSLWFGTINGLCKFNPSLQVMNQVPPVLSLLDVKLAYESLLTQRNKLIYFGMQHESLILEHTQNRITFDFMGINLSRPSEVMYRWRLIGFDDTWSPPSKEQSIMYSNLEPGEYTFELKASNEDGVWSPTARKFSFTIVPPYWQKWWFKLLVFLAVVLFLIVGYRFLTQRIRRKANARQQQMQMTNDFLELEQKALRLQMNPHFIFNALNSIQSLIGTGKETEARYYLAKFSRLMRQILDNSRKVSITLEEEINTLENYLLIEQFCSPSSFQYTITVDPNLEIDFIELPPMMIQPFVENAIKHGMKGKNVGEGKIDIRFQEEDNTLICVITDNGIGRERAAEINANSKETYHESASMEVIKERLDILNKGIGKGSLEIIDLKDDQNRPQGTEVRLKLPLE